VDARTCDSDAPRAVEALCQEGHASPHAWVWRA
jgi:hypothetical protein